MQSLENVFYPEHLMGHSDIRQLFPDVNAPLEVEIGCGKGKFIVQRAMENPACNFAALDWDWKWMKIGVARALKRELKNLIFYKGHAMDFISNHVQEETAAHVHLYFPDPWPKKRHHKRRSFKEELLQRVHAILLPGGTFQIATDNEDYFFFMCQQLEQSAVPWRHQKHSHQRIFDSQNKTNYELKYEQQGLPLYYIELQKKEH